MIKKAFLIVLAFAVLLNSFWVCAAETNDTDEAFDDRAGAGFEYTGVDIDSFYNNSSTTNLIGTSGINYIDIKDEYIRNVAVLLTEIGIISNNGNKFYPENSVTRAELAEAAVNICNTDVDAMSAIVTSSYYDVKKEQYPYVYAATALGLVSGYPDNSFRPNDKADYNEILKVLLYAAGYREEVSARGGYPVGVTAMANRLGLKVKPDSNGNITRQNFAQILMDLLESDFSEKIGFDSQGDSFEANYRGNVLSYYHDIYKESGILTMNGVTSMNSDKITDHYLSVNGKNVKDEENRFVDFIGYNVDVWYSDKGNTPTVVYVAKQDNVKEISIVAENFLSYEKGKINYYEGGKKKTQNLKTGFEVIKNGAYLSKYDSSIFDIKSGKITLINNGSGYDTVNIEEYHNFVVSQIDVDDTKIEIRTKYSYGVIEFDLNDTCLQLYKNGAKVSYVKKNAATNQTVIDLSDIKADSVLSIAASESYKHKNTLVPSEDAKYIKIYATDIKASGTVESISKDKVQIGEKFFETSESNLFDEFRMTPEVGQTGDFYLDVSGKIVGYANQDDDNWKYAYIIAYKNGNSLEDSLSLKLLDSDGEINIYETTKKIKINGARKSPSETTGILKNSAKLLRADYDISQVIKYKSNTDNVITEIECLRDNFTKKDEGTDELRLSVKATKYDIYYTSGYNLYNLTTQQIESVTPQVCFSVPEVETKNDSEYQVTPLNSFGQSSTKTMELYDSNKYYKPMVGVIYEAAQAQKLITGRNNSAHPVIYVSSSIVSDEEKGSRYKIHCVSGMGGEVSYVLKDESLIKDLKKGDCIWLYGVRSTNEVTKIEPLEYDGVALRIDALPNLNMVAASSNGRRFAQAYAIDGKNCVTQRGYITDENTGERENHAVVYLTTTPEVIKGGVIVVDGTENPDEPVIRSGSYTDIQTVENVGEERASKLLIGGLSHDLTGLIVYNGY